MQRAAIVSLVVVIVLGLGAWFTLKRGKAPGPVAPPAWMRLIEASKVEALSVTLSANESVTVARVQGTDLWMMRHSRDGNVVLEAPVRADQVRGVVRLMHDLDALPGDAEAGAWGGGVHVTMYTDKEPVADIEIASGALGGRVPVLLHAPSGARTVLADGRLVSMFTAASLDAWRDDSLFSRLPGEYSRIRVESEGGAVAIAKAGAGWNVLEPVMTAADSSACTALVANVSEMRGQIAAQREAEVGALPLRVAIETETLVRRIVGAEVETSVLRQIARVHEGTGGQLLAVVSAAWEKGEGTTPAWRTTVVEIATAALPVPEAGVLLSRVSSRVAGVDVAGLRFAATEGDWLAEFSRGLEGWKGTGVSANRGVTTDETAGLGALVKLLCETEASAATLAPPADTKNFARVAVVVGGIEAELMELGLGSVPLPSGVAEVLVVRVGKVSRVYPALEHKALMGWLRFVTTPGG